MWTGILLHCRWAHIFIPYGWMVSLHVSKHHQMRWALVDGPSRTTYVEVAAGAGHVRKLERASSCERSWRRRWPVWPPAGRAAVRRYKGKRARKEMECKYYGAGRAGLTLDRVASPGGRDHPCTILQYAIPRTRTRPSFHVPLVTRNVAWYYYNSCMHALHPSSRTTRMTMELYMRVYIYICILNCFLMWH